MLENVTFLFVGFVICFLMEFVYLFQIRQRVILSFKSTEDQLQEWKDNSAGCLPKLFYVFFTIYLLFTPLWLVGLLLLVLGIITARPLQNLGRSARAIEASGSKVKPESLINTGIVYVLIDGLISLVILAYGLYLTYPVSV